MRSLPLMRTEYWNLSTNTVRSGPTAHIESLTDIENYLLPAAQVQASSLYAWGVADGLLVSAVPNQPDVTLSPGVALDAAGHLIALAANGFAIIDPTVDPNQVQNIPTVRVEPTGVALSTAGLSGECFLTLTWREVLDPSQPANAPILLHAPWVRLLDVAAFQDLGDQVIVARVSLDPAGLVTALAIDGRRLVGLPASRLELRRPRAAAAPTLSVDHLAAAELGVHADGGLALTLLPPTGAPRPALTVDGAAGTLGLVPEGGRVGIGTPSPGATLVVHDAAAAELRVDGNAGAVGLTLGADATEAWLGSRTNHDLRLVTNGTERLRVLADGKVGLGTATPTHPLDITGALRLRATTQTNLLIAQHGTANDNIAIDFGKGDNLTPSASILFDGATDPAVHRASLGFFTRGAADTELVERVRISEDGNMGIGTATPQGKLDVRGDMRAGNSDLYFTKTDHNHTGIGNTAGFAAIENAADYGALMILGRAGTARGRSVRLWDYLQVNGGLDVTGAVGIGGGLNVSGDMRAGNSDLYFTKTNHNHTGIGNTAGFAAIENAADYGALMILGRAGTARGRSVRLWDYLQVNGGLDVTGAVGIGGGLNVSGDMRAGNSDLYFTKTNHNHTGIGNTAGFAAIENAVNYDALMILGRAGTALGRYVRLWDYLQVNGSMDVTGNVYIYGRLIAPRKQGYVMDQFVNRLGEALEQGDVVVIGENQSSLYYGPNNNIPIPEIDIAQRAYDTRICGIVDEVHAFLQAEQAARIAGESDWPTAIQCREFTPEELEKLDRTKVEPGQLGGMVTLGAFASCKVDADIAPVVIGDLLTTSPTKGHAQKVLDPGKAVGAILGKALGSLEKGKGKIPVFVMLQ